MKIIIKNNVDFKEWENLLQNSEEATIFHTLEWLIILEKTYSSYQKKFILAYENKEIIGGLPFILTKKNFFKKIFSLPFGTYGGTILKSKVKENVREALFKKLIDFYNKHLTITSLQVVDFFNKFNVLTSLGFQKEERYTFLTRVNKDIREIWTKDLSSDARNKVRQGKKYGLKVEEVDSPEEVKKCFSMFVEVDKRHGYSKPIYPLSLFINIYFIFNKKYLKWFKVNYDNKSIANILAFTFKNSIMAWAAASYEEYLYLRPNNVLFWTLIEFGNKEGYEYVNFSSVEKNQKGLVHFKEGFTKEKKYYTVYWKRKFKK